VLLPREGILSRGGNWGQTGIYGLTAHVQRWQTLQADPLAPITPPYNRQPQITFTAQNWDLMRTDFDMLGQYVDFSHPTLVNGKRLVAYPSVSMPLQSAYAYLTPKVGAHFTHYALDKSTTTLPDATRTLPIFTTEAGLVFERDTRIAGQPFIQTLEPKIYYVYIPFRDQSQIPIFDSGARDINLATIFAENQFSGQDRINDANQITFGVSSRFVNADNGIERVRVALAQRYYFQPQQVTVPGVPLRSSQSSSSDLLAALSGTVARNWVAEAGWQYNTDLSQTQKFNVGTRYQPQPGKVLNLVYHPAVDGARTLELFAARQPDARRTGRHRIQWRLLGLTRGRSPVRHSDSASFHIVFPATGIKRCVAPRIESVRCASEQYRRLCEAGSAAAAGRGQPFSRTMTCPSGTEILPDSDGQFIASRFLSCCRGAGVCSIELAALRLGAKAAGRHRAGSHRRCH
jgi:LPS-assembly protein